MRLLKILGLGTLISFFVVIGWLGWLMRPVSDAPGLHAVGLNAIKAVTWYNPIFWLMVLVAYGAAAWVIKRSGPFGDHNRGR